MQPNPYVKQFPDLMVGKKIMYIHGFASAASTGSVERIRTMLPSADVVAEDVPLHPSEALTMLREMARREQPDLIIGTSMGGMYAELLHGYDRILINPALRIADTMAAHGMTGRQTYYHPRKDGVQEFIVTKALVREFRDVQELCLTCDDAAEQERVWGLFGDEDQLVHTYDLFRQHYAQAIAFHGDHYMTDPVFLHSVTPVIRWIDDRQNQRQRPVVLVSIDALRGPRGQQQSSAVKAFRMLIEHYDVYIVAPSPYCDAAFVEEVQRWTADIVNVPAYRHLIFTNRADLLLGDYLIAPFACPGFMGTHLHFGSDTFKTWEELMVYFGRIGGQ